METYALLGAVVLEDRVVPDGAVIVENGTITYAGRASGICLPENVRETDGLIAPGFIDIHCHAGGEWYCHENPRAVAKYHLEHGSTGMLFTMYRSVPVEMMIKHTYEIKALMPELTNVLGVHLEGPYLNPVYGAGEGVEVPIRKDDYVTLAESGIIRQWTCSPEFDGAEEFIRDIASMGIVPAIGHSNASPEDVNRAVDAGARIVTHLFDATGSSVEPTRCRGTIETSFNTAVMIKDNLYYELICDKNGIHVRPEMAKLAIKTVGVDRIVGITDCCTGSPDDSDVNMLGTDLMGSKMTMNMAAKNFYALGLTVPEVFRVCSLNPAKALGIDGAVGSLAPGKRADILILDRDLELREVLKA